MGNSLAPQCSATYPERVIQWQTKVRTESATVSSLLYRHYLVQYSFGKDILFTEIPEQICFLFNTFPPSPCDFGPVGRIDLYIELSGTQHPILHWRRVRPTLLLYVMALANRADVTAYRLQRDHALLSSVTLMYIAALVRVWLFEVKASNALLHHAETFDALKGAVSHVETQWLSTSLS